MEEQPVLYFKGTILTFDPLDQLSLIFANSSANMGSDKECVETRKDAEHFVGILGRAKLITEAGAERA